MYERIRKQGFRSSHTAAQLRNSTEENFRLPHMFGSHYRIGSWIRDTCIAVTAHQIGSITPKGLIPS